MNNKVTFFGLASISLFGFISNAPANANIPQTSIQEILIEGEFNQVNQQLNQSLNLHFIYLPYIEESIIPTFNIQGTFLNNPNNQVNQNINQNILDFSLSETTPDSLNLDDILNGEQFITQEVFIEGNSNLITQNSSQALTDFTWLDTSIAVTENNNFTNFLDRLLINEELNSFQFGLQDTFILGENNIVSQNIDQTFNNYIFTNNNFDSLFDTNAIDDEIGLDFAQFTIQETFIDIGQNSLVTQSINQKINDISFIDTSIFSEQPRFVGKNNNVIVGKNNSVEFDIDAFINGILNDTIVEATQTNFQRSETIGNENIDTQENVQVVVVSVPEPSFVKVMGLLLLMIGMRSRYKKRLNPN